MSDSDRRHRVDVTLRQRDIDLAEVIGTATGRRD